MKRAFVPGYFDHDVVARATTCCTGECNQGRSCPLTVDRVCRGTVRAEPVRQRPVIGAQLAPGSWVPVRPAIQHVRVSRLRRARRALRALWRFLLAPRWQP
jgi:hypothetical protein